MSLFNPSSEAKLDSDSLMPGVAGPDEPIQMGHSEGGRADSAFITDPMMAEPIDGDGTMTDGNMLRIARQCFDTSEDYFNATQRSRVMDAMARFRSRHPKASRYWSEAFERRSKLFRPKTRTVIRRREAATVAALFSSSDVVNVTATSAGDPKAARDARIQDALLNARLTNDDRWYKFCVGAQQDADRQGIVIATTEWEYREATRYFEQADDQGNRKRVVVNAPTVDRPNARLIPIENIRFSPGVSWIDPINTSPFLIELRPLFLSDIREYEKNPRARLKYRHLTDAQLLTGADADSYDPVRIQREGGKLDRYSRNGEVTEFAVIWVHRNIVRLQGEDYVFETVGSSLMLSDVVPLSAVDPRGYRPYVIGSATLESHNPYPEGVATLMGPLQDAIDVNANLRVDASNMATAGRMFVARNAGIDLHALARFSPGAVVEMQSTSQVKWDRPPAPPQSNMEENELLNTEIDDLVGNFDQGSNQRQRPGQDQTLGGTQMLSEGAGQLTEYDLRTMAKTFFEPVLRQMLDLIRIWETDRGMASAIGSKFAADEREYWNAIQTPTELNVDVGYAATNPMKRLEKLTVGLKTMSEMFPYLMMMSDQSEITAEIFAACGYADASRFFPFLDQKSMEDPKYKTLIMQLNQMRMLTFPNVAMAQGRQQQGLAQAQGAIQAAQIRANNALAVARENNQAKYVLRELELDLARVELELEREKNDMQRQSLMIQREKLSNDIAVAQQNLILEAQATPMAQNPIEEQPLNPKTQELTDRLQVPGSGDVDVPSLAQDLQAAQGSPTPDEMTAGELDRMMHQQTPAPDLPPITTSNEMNPDVPGVTNQQLAGGGVDGQQ